MALNNGCWGRWCARLCIKNRRIKIKNEVFRKLLQSQLNLMHHLVHTNISSEDAMEHAATIEKILKEN